MKSISRRNWLRKSLLASSAYIVAGNIPVAAIDPYISQVNLSSEYLRLNWNENPYGPSSKAIEAVTNIMKSANRYPDAMVTELKSILSSDYNLSNEHIIITAGSTEILSLLGQHVGLIKGEILSPYPSFPTLLQFGQSCGATIKKIPLDNENRIDLNSLKSAITNKTKLIFICNPNNPTSTEVSKEALINFCESVPSEIIICVDEAYIEYSKNGTKSSVASLVAKHSNLIVCRTFSKAYGIAGLRIGYGLAHPEIVSAIRSRHLGWELSAGVAPIAAALASYHDHDYLNMCVNKNEEGRRIVYNSLDKWNIPYSNSSTNFIYLESAKFDQNVVAKLRDENVLITKWPDMNDHIRISIGKTEEMEVFVQKIEKHLIP